MKTQPIYFVEETFADGTKQIDEWDATKIKRAFNHGQGTLNDFKRYLELNKTTTKLLQ